MLLPIEWLPAQGAPEQLILLLHGWGGDGMAVAPLAQVLRSHIPLRTWQAALGAAPRPRRAVDDDEPD